ncbi:MAG: HAMP domain-containing protein [Desulfobacteraceae bacterium]|nr:HAMP domain-containing protein [Desulfobacteraceae bacterium]
MKLSWLIILPIVALVLLSGVVNVVVTSYILDEKIEDDLNGKEVNVLNSLSRRIYGDVQEGYSAAVTDVIFEERNRRREEIDYIVVFDDEGEILAHTFTTAIPDEIQHLDEPFHTEEYKIKTVEISDAHDGDGEAEELYDVSIPIYNDVNLQVGSIHIGYCKEHLAREKNALTNVALGVTVVVAIAAIVVAAFVTRSIVRPIKDLTGIAEKVKNGNLAVKAEPKGTDEVIELSEAFNQMILSVRLVAGEMYGTEEPTEAPASEAPAPEAPPEAPSEETTE